MGARTRVAAAGVALALVAVTLGGCSAIGTVVKKAGDAVQAAEKPVAGECWAASVDTIVSYADWDGSPAVPCTSRHDTFTYAVEELGGYYTSKTWEKKPGDNAVAPGISDDAWTACDGALDPLLPDRYDFEDRFYPSFFLPSFAQWRQGARWVRCDISLISVDSLVSKPRFDALPVHFSEIVTAFKQNPKTYRYCLQTNEAASAQSDPFSSATARIADCSKSPQWSESNADYFPQTGGATYPSADDINAFLDQVCGPLEKDGIVTLAYPPSEDDWKLGSRQVECWSATEGAAPNA